VAISPYVRGLRARVGSLRLLLPSVAALVLDGAGRLLLVRQADDGVWSLPGGVVEPDEAPADAVVRETWEETGLAVEPVRLAAVHGGPEFVVRYPNGDETQYVIVVFACEVRGGAPRADGDETTDVAFFSAEEVRALPLAPWLAGVIGGYFDPAGSPPFAPPQCRPTVEGADSNPQSRAMATIRIDVQDLLFAMESQDMVHHLDRRTGELHMRPADGYLDDVFDDDEGEDLDFSDSTRFARVEPVESSEAFRWREDFAEAQEPRVRDALLRALDGRGPFRRFKEALLEFPPVREAWFRYEEERLLAAARSWLAFEEIDAELVLKRAAE
jgi:8-oxo-dGTP diphosphatase